MKTSIFLLNFIVLTAFCPAIHAEERTSQEMIDYLEEDLTRFLTEVDATGLSSFNDLQIATASLMYVLSIDLVRVVPNATTEQLKQFQQILSFRSTYVILKNLDEFQEWNEQSTLPFITQKDVRELVPALRDLLRDMRDLVIDLKQINTEQAMAFVNCWNTEFDTRNISTELTTKTLFRALGTYSSEILDDVLSSCSVTWNMSEVNFNLRQIHSGHEALDAVLGKAFAKYLAEQAHIYNSGLAAELLDTYVNKGFYNQTPGGRPVYPSFLNIAESAIQRYGEEGWIKGLKEEVIKQVQERPELIWKINE